MTTEAKLPRSTPANPALGQQALPFLDQDDVATIDAARAAVLRAENAALSARRLSEAAELGRLGDQLIDLLERNATATRARRWPTTAR